MNTGARRARVTERTLDIQMAGSNVHRPKRPLQTHAHCGCCHEFKLSGNLSGDMTPQQDSLLGVIICPYMLNSTLTGSG